MEEFLLGYREVVPDQTVPEKWNEITLNTGGSQSTLQDIKVPERAGGYSYKDCSKYFTRNRFIYWRISHDVLELVEHSLDINLVNCRVRYKFTDTPILDGISIHETINSVIILVVTVSSIHKLSFPHPERIHKNEHSLNTYKDLGIQSIFSEATAQNVKKTKEDPHTFHVITNAGTTNSPVPHAAASWFVPPQEALFALAYNSGIILLLKLDIKTGLVHTSELKEDSIVPRFLSGIATAFRGRTSEAHVAMSLIIHSYGNDTYLFALCREGNIRMWSCNKVQCVAVADAAIDNRVASQGAQSHVMRKALGLFWILQERNAAELLRLMLNTGRILEASDLAVQYINAVLGDGKEHFGLKTPLTSIAPAVWLPFNTLEVLLYELEEASKENIIFSEGYQKLQKALNYYEEKVIRVSKDMIEIKLSKRNY